MARAFDARPDSLAPLFEEGRGTGRPRALSPVDHHAQVPFGVLPQQVVRDQSLLGGQLVGDHPVRTEITGGHKVQRETQVAEAGPGVTGIEGQRRLVAAEHVDRLPMKQAIRIETHQTASRAHEHDGAPPPRDVQGDRDQGRATRGLDDDVRAVRAEDPF